MAGEVRPHSYLGRRLGDVFCIAFRIGVWRQPMDCSVVVEPYSARTLECLVALWGDAGAVKHRQDLNRTEGYVRPREGAWGVNRVYVGSFPGQAVAIPL